MFYSQRYSLSCILIALSYCTFALMHELHSSNTFPIIHYTVFVLAPSSFLLRVSSCVLSSHARDTCIFNSMQANLSLHPQNVITQSNLIYPSFPFPSSLSSNFSFFTLFAFLFYYLSQFYLPSNSSSVLRSSTPTFSSYISFSPPPVLVQRQRDRCVIKPGRCPLPQVRKNSMTRLLG